MAKKKKEEMTMIAGRRRFELTHVRKTEFTRKFADWYLALPQIDADRALQEAHALDLAIKIEDGVFLGEDVNVATVVVEESGKEYKINGQHTCRARQWFGTEDIGMKVQHSKYKVENFEDAADLYAQFDDSDGKRTFDQKAKPKWAAQGLSENYSHHLLKWATAAIAFDRVGRKAHSIKTIKKDERINLPSQEEKFVQFLDSVIGSKAEAAHIRKSPVACAIFQCWKKSQSASEVFWTQVRDGERLTKNMPSMKLRDFTIKIAYRVGKGALEARPASFDEIYSRCIYAWNAFRRAESEGTSGSLKVLRYVASAKTPLAI